MACLGRPKACCAQHIERKLAPTISPVSAIPAILVPEMALVDDPRMGFEIRSKNWFRRQGLPSK